MRGAGPRRYFSPNHLLLRCVVDKTFVLEQRLEVPGHCRHDVKEKASRDLQALPKDKPPLDNASGDQMVG